MIDIREVLSQIRLGQFAAAKALQISIACLSPASSAGFCFLGWCHRSPLLVFVIGRASQALRFAIAIMSVRRNTGKPFPRFQSAQFVSTTAFKNYDPDSGDVGRRAEVRLGFFRLHSITVRYFFVVANCGLLLSGQFLRQKQRSPVLNGPFDGIGRKDALRFICKQNPFHFLMQSRIPVVDFSQDGRANETRSILSLHQQSVDAVKRLIRKADNRFLSECLGAGHPAFIRRCQFIVQAISSQSHTSSLLLTIKTLL